MSENPFMTEDQPVPVTSATRSIVDQVLNLDEFLSADVRLAVKQAAFYTRPDLEAEIEERNAELDSLTDSRGRPLTPLDPSIADGERTAPVVADEILALQKEYAASRRVILMQQLDEDEWAAFQQKWKEALAGEPPYPPEFYTDLIVRTAHRPKITEEQLAQIRKKVGGPAFDALWRTAWYVNTQSGVSIPKSWLASQAKVDSKLF